LPAAAGLPHQFDALLGTAADRDKQFAGGAAVPEPAPSMPVTLTDARALLDVSTA